MDVSDEEEVATVLNRLHKVNLHGAANSDEWRQLIDEYFLSSAEAENEDSDDSMDSDIESADNPPTALPLEDTEDRALVFDAAGDVLQTIEGDYVSEDHAQELQKAQNFKCNCKMNDGQPCYMAFSPENITQRRDLMLELTTGKCWPFIFGYAIICVIQVADCFSRSCVKDVYIME